jgi:hypothetical protein
LKIPHCPDFFWTAASCWTSAPLKTPVYRRTAFQGSAPSFVEQAAPRRARHLFTKKLMGKNCKEAIFTTRPSNPASCHRHARPYPTLPQKASFCHYRATTSQPFHTKSYLPLPCKAPPLSLPCKAPQCHCHAKNPHCHCRAKNPHCHCRA